MRVSLTFFFFNLALERLFPDLLENTGCFAVYVGYIIFYNPYISKHCLNAKLLVVSFQERLVFGLIMFYHGGNTETSHIFCSSNSRI